MKHKRRYWRANVVLFYQPYGAIEGGWHPRYAWMYDPFMRRAAKIDIVMEKAKQLYRQGWVPIGIWPRTRIPRNAWDKARA